MSNERDCPHGRQTGKCADCDVAELERENHKFRAHIENQTKELDQLIPMAEKLEAQAERDTALLRQALEVLECFLRFAAIHRDGPDASDKYLAEDYAEEGFLKAAKLLPALRERLEKT